MNGKYKKISYKLSLFELYKIPKKYNMNIFLVTCTPQRML
jgi:hypothetical protein